MLSREAIVEGYERHVSQATARLARQLGTPVEVRSAGSLVWDAQGREYLDCGGYGVFLLGHRHPEVVAALHAQLDRHPLATRGMLSPELATAAARLAEVTPAGLEYVYFASTGAEAVETALKLARAAGRRRVVSMRGGFHGKTLGALSITDRSAFQRPFRPLLPGVTTVPFGNADALRAALADDPDRACVVVEPVQGEGGVRVPPPGYLAAVAEACRAAQAFLVVDEIQTGVGRLGEWWGCAAEGVVPDVLVTGKALSGGCVPVSAVVATERAFLPLNRDARLHTSTFSGAPLAMAAVCATIDVVQREHLVERARSLGAQLLAEITTACAGAMPDRVREVRGRGLLIGIELATPALAARLARQLLADGLIVAGTLGVDTVLRLSPPAVLTDAQAHRVVETLHRAVRRLDTGQSTNTTGTVATRQ
jgi:putrescine aminotransferase